MDRSVERPAYRELAPRAPDGPIDLGALLPGEGDIEIDVGIGRGRSLFERAAAAPGARLVGIELKSKWAFKVEERRQKLGLPRVRVLAGDARDILGRAVPEASVARLFVHFPDPWWKKRHERRRLVDRPFLDLVARLLRDGGELFVQTDVEERAELYLALVSGHPAFERARYVDANPYANPSNREVRAAEDGLPVFRLLAARTPRGQSRAV